MDFRCCSSVFYTAYFGGNIVVAAGPCHQNEHAILGQCGVVKNWVLSRSLTRLNCLRVGGI